MLPNLKVIALAHNQDKLSKLYGFYTHIDVEVGDAVVCANRINLTKDLVFSIAYVVSLTPSADIIAKTSRCIVSKIDIAEYEKVCEQLEKTKELKALLKSRREQLDEAMIYARLAEVDPEMQKLVSQLNDLTPNAIPELTNTIKEDKADE